jgi:hypothetical protein
LNPPVFKKTDYAMKKSQFALPCTFISAFVAGSLAGGLSLDAIGLPAPIATTLGAAVAAGMFMSTRVRAFWRRTFDAQ